MKRVAVGDKIIWSVDRDDFNRADGDIGSAWDRGMQSNPDVRIRSNGVHGGPMADNTGRQACCWTRKWDSLFTDQNRVIAKLTAPIENQAANNFTTIFLGSPDTWGSGQWVYFSVSTGSGSFITSCNGIANGPGGSATGGGNQTTRASGGGNVANNALIEFRRTWVASGSYWRYDSYVNNSITMSWSDTTGIVPVGSTRRKWGFCIEGNDPLFQAEVTSAGIDWIEGRDW